MNEYLIVILFSLIGGLLSLVGAAILLAKTTNLTRVARYATPFAAGALLAAVFLDLLPEGIEQSDAQTVLTAALLGILIFFIAERFLRWFHHHHEDDEKHSDPTTSLIITGDTLHNALDGVAIGAAFLVSIPTGIVATIAIAAHEIPQEIGDAGLLLSKGLTKKKVLVINALSSLATVVAALLTFALGSGEGIGLSILLGLSAGFLLYVALSDIIPTIHSNTDASKLIQLQTLMLFIGVAVVSIAINLAHDYIDAGHDKNVECITVTNPYPEDVAALIGPCIEDEGDHHESDAHTH